MKNERKNLKKNQLISFGITLLVIVAVNIIASFVYTRFDLTSEKRYTLSDTSKEILKNLDDYVYFRVYLEGDFPAGFKKLRKEKLEEITENTKFLKEYDRLSKQFEDIGDSETVQEIELFITDKVAPNIISEDMFLEFCCRIIISTIKINTISVIYNVFCYIQFS